MDIELPDSALVILIGPSGAGKTTFAARHFSRTEVVSSDECRALVSDDDRNMAATPAAFRVLHSIARERMRAGRLTVIDATNVKPSSRKPLLALARRYSRPAAGIVFDLPLEVCLARMDTRRQRIVPPDAVRRQHAGLVSTLDRLGAEGFDRIHVLRSAADVDGTVIRR